MWLIQNATLDACGAGGHLLYEVACATAIETVHAAFCVYADAVAYVARVSQ